MTVNINGQVPLIKDKVFQIELKATFKHMQLTTDEE